MSEDQSATRFHSLSVGGLTRRYLVQTPNAITRNKLPVVVFLHGTGGTARWSLEETGIHKTADREGFILVVPEGSRPDPGKPPGFLSNPQSWNAGSGGLLGESTADDVSFIDAMLDQVFREYSADPQRVFVTGFSNGAGMTFRLAAELAERFAALAPVAGYVTLPNPRPSRPLPTLYILGLADPLVPLAGGTVLSPWTKTKLSRPPVVAGLERWAAALGCSPEPIQIEDHDGLRQLDHGHGRGGVEMKVYLVEGLGHHWPGGRGQLNPRFAGPPSNRVVGNDMIWDFFRSINVR